MIRNQILDLMRGGAIFLMLITHFLQNWLPTSEMWALIIFRLCTNIFLVNQFIFTAGLGLGISLSRDSDFNTSRIPSKNWYQQSLLRTLLLLLLSGGYNLIALLIHQYSWWNLWYWYILQSIMICRFIGILLIRVKPWILTIIALILIPLPQILLEQLTTPPYLLWKQVVYIICFNPLDANSPLIYGPFFLIGMSIGQYLTLDKASSINKKYLQKKCLIGFIMGFVCILSSMVFGRSLSSHEWGWHYIDLLNIHPEWHITGFPLFLIYGSPFWVIFALGWQLILLSILYWGFHLRDSSWIVSNRHILSIFGKYSLTIYLLQYIAYFFPVIPLRWIWLPIIGMILLFYGVICLNDVRLHGVVSIEFLINSVIRKIVQSTN